MRDIYATTMQLVHIGGGDAFDVASDRALTWAWRIDDPRPDLTDQPVGSLPADALPNQTKVDWWAVTGGTARALEVRLQHPDDREEALLWLSTVTLSDIGGTTRATVRLEQGASVHELRPWRLDLRAPGIVLELMRPPLLAYAGTLELAAGPRVLRSGEIGDFVVDVLRANGRALPVLIASRRVHPDAVAVLAKALGGLAQVARLGSQEAEAALGSVLGETGYTVPTGGLRLYWPGFGQDNQPRRHPYWTASQLRQGSKPGEVAVRQLVGMLAPISTGRVPIDPGVMVARREWVREQASAQREREEARRKQLRRERKKVAEAMARVATQQGAGQEVERLQAQIEQIRADLALAEQERELALERAEAATANELKVIDESIGIEERATAAKARAAELEGENTALRANIKTLSTYRATEAVGQEDADVDVVPEEVQTWEEVAEHLPELAGPGFVLTSQAEECAASENRYPNPNAMWQALRALERVGRRYNEQEASLGMRFEDFALGVGGLDVALQDSTYRTACFFEFEKQKYSRLPHVKIDDAKAPNEVGRIYFALDPEQKRLIVDWFGTKPDRPETPHKS